MCVDGLKDLRKLAGVSIEKAADVCGVSVGTLWNVENGKTALVGDQVAKVLAFYISEARFRLDRVEKLLMGRPDSGVSGR